MSLRSSAVHGVRWAGVGRVVQNVIAVAATAILARLLSPEDFGLMGMALVVLAFLQLFGEVGIGAALIQRQHLSRRLLSTAFWVNAIVGIGVAGAIMEFSPLVAWFFNEKRLEAIVSVLSVALFFNVIAVVPKCLLERELDFEAIAKTETLAVTTGAVVGIASAHLGQGVWSLVYQSIATAFIGTIAMWMVVQWRPGVEFSWTDLRSVMGFSFNLTGFKIVSFFARNADRILIGRYLGTADMGYYTLAYQIVLYPVQNISRVIGRVLFPTLSRMQDDDERMQRACLQVVPIVAIVTLPMMFGIGAVAKPFVEVVLGPGWDAVAVLIVIMAPIGAGRAVGFTGLFEAKGRTGLQFVWGSIHSAVIVLAFGIGLHWGVYGVATAYAIATFALLYPGWRLNYGLIDLPVRRVVATLMRPLGAGGGMFAIVWLAGKLMPETWPEMWMLVAQVSIGIVSYCLLLYRLESGKVQQVIDVLRGNSVAGSR